jgi:ubiquinone/menaquinone biosynthesis C-methylase UbiE
LNSHDYMKKETVGKILSQTKHGYDMVSKKFSQTRKHFWRNLEFIGDYAKDGDSVLDWGCGNGRLFELLGGKKIGYLGLDVSQQLLDEASEHHGGENREFKRILSSQNSIASPDSSFNSVYSIAVFHHLPGKEYREKTAQEIYRNLKPGGYVVITVWNLWQDRYRKKIFKNWKNKILGKSELDWNDCRISFTDNEGKKFHRYHHAFTKRELRKLFRRAGFEIQRCDVIDGRNIVLVGKK